MILSLRAAMEVAQYKTQPFHELLVDLVKGYDLCDVGNLLEAGLGQGCCVAPLLFSVFLSAIFEAWQCKSAGGPRWLARIEKSRQIFCFVGLSF